MKAFVLMLEDGEEEIFDRILLALNGEETGGRSSPEVKCSKLDFRDFTIDFDRHLVEREGTDVNLTATEFAILQLLAENPGIVFSKEKIYSTVWQEANIGDCSIIMNHIHNIREKIGDSPAQPVYIQTVWGVGYRFNSSITSS